MYNKNSNSELAGFASLNRIYKETPLEQLVEELQNKLINKNIKNKLDLIVYFSDEDIAPYFEEIYCRYEKPMLHYCQRFTNNNKETALDLFHDVIMKVFMNILTYKSQKSFNSWIYKIAHNYSLSSIKKKNREIPILNQPVRLEQHGIKEFIDTFYEVYNVEEKILDTDIKEKLKEAVLKLPEDYQYVYYLKETGCTFEEIAVVLNFTSKTAKTIYKKILYHVQQELKKHHINLKEILKN